MASVKSLGCFVLALVSLVAANQAALARDIHLGGSQSEAQGKTKQNGPRYIELPQILVSIPRADGGYNHVQIDAWLAPVDDQTFSELDAVRSSISRQARDENLPAQGYDALKRPGFGNDIAKKAIHGAAEQSIGHPWDGEVFIRNMLIY